MSGKSEKIALFPGTFDPLTNGHLDVIRRGHQLFDRLIVAIGTNPTKAELFTSAEREAMLRQVVADEALAVDVESYDGLTVDFAKERRATVILRGLRNAEDLAHEFQLALANRAIADLETVFIMSGEPFGFTSSSLIKQIAAAGDIDRLRRVLPPLVIDEMKRNIDRIRRLAGATDLNRQ
ncbi:MAG: pantetheine-phosphate adenylyltransferase [Phycisphaerae bacterium]|nr:pantetheine-phosphate adenylyltransferase [Phycisphaerae bacterium]